MTKAKNMAKGYMGKILLVDLSNQKIHEEQVDKGLYRNFLGGSGLGIKIIYDRQKSNVYPLGKESILGFTTGLLEGAGIPFANRYFVVGKSPLTNTWADSNGGGYFGPELKSTGYDGVFFTGISKGPVYLWVNDGKVEIRNAGHIWGEDTTDTEKMIKGEVGNNVKVACIGPSGEKLSLISAIINDGGRAAARSGLAAVMGSKNLKALVVKGSKRPQIHDKEQISKLREEYLSTFRENPIVEILSMFGTNTRTVMHSESGESPCKNWEGAGSIDFLTSEKIGCDNLKKYEVGKFYCKNCPVGCGARVKVVDGPYAIEEGQKPEYETVCSFGTLCLNDDLESIIKLNDICNRSGLDTVSTGSTIAFAIECFERGLITKADTGGVDLKWGNTGAIVEMTEKIAKREGFGDVLADGVVKASQYIGKGSVEYAITAGNQELPMHDPKNEPTLSISYKADPTPGKRHLVCESLAEISSIREVFPVIEFSPYKGVDDYMNKAFMLAIYSKYFEVISSCGLCALSLPMSIPPIVGWINSITGWDLNKNDILAIGGRILTLKQSFNVREGIRPSDIKLSGRAIGKPPLEKGPLKDVTIDVDKMVKAYYKEMGWDIDSGKPSK
ncbi:MAG TPA: aldehyde ferredoxin oxidoreductase family protein [Thermoplasmata archaeon]|nr:aldehyde ferredoxin oxidoreductase family protein [Thermoplasmata archaeon]